MQVTLADVINRRVPLSAREAATITLAVGREWDRQRAIHGLVPLADVGAIELHQTGEVSFLVQPQALASGSVQSAPLSSLLGKLLGIDEADPPRQQVPGGLLITIAGRLGPMELPSASEDGFRTALARFADDDHRTVVANVFSRAASVCREAQVDITPQRRSANVPSPDRRRQPRIVTELRLEIRQLEQELFKLKARSARAVAAPAAAEPAMPARAVDAPAKSGSFSSEGVVTLGVAAACVLALLFIPASAPNPKHGTPAVAGASRSATSTDSGRKAVESSGIGTSDSATPSPRSTAGARARVEGSTKPAARTPIRRRVVASTTDARRPATFAGGTRNIAWLAAR